MARQRSCRRQHVCQSVLTGLQVTICCWAEVSPERSQARGSLVFTGLKDAQQALWDQSEDTLLVFVWCQDHTYGLCAGLLN